MRYVMQQKLLSLADSFTIKDENERDAFLARGSCSASATSCRSKI
jgi:uncharacterized protein YxjI